MSEEFHVHAAHDHEIEHLAHKGVGLAQTVAIFTAILSTFAAVVSYNSASEQTEALMLKNEAIIKQTQASDQWAFYQSKSNKLHLMELASQIVPNKSQYYNQQMQKYNQQKDQIKNSATSLEAASFQADEKSDSLMSKHHQESQGMMLVQIAISLASITALTRKRWLFTLASLAAVGGILFSALSWI